MSRYTYEGNFSNPAGNFIVVENPEGEGYIIAVKQESDAILRDLLSGAITTEEASLRNSRGWRPHSKGLVFEESEEGEEWIEGVAEAAEADYDDYLEENRFEICRMEAYEQFRNEY